MSIILVAGCKKFKLVSTDFAAIVVFAKTYSCFVIEANIHNLYITSEVERSWQNTQVMTIALHLHLVRKLNITFFLIKRNHCKLMDFLSTLIDLINSVTCKYFATLYLSNT